MLDGKTIIITGASSGIGKALGFLLSKKGATVILAARRKGLLEDTVRAINTSGAKATAVQCDVTIRREAEDLVGYAVRKFGGLDILINNAGRGHFASVEDTTDEMIASMFAVNVFALWYTTRPALRQMKLQEAGHIINVSSLAGKLGYPYNSAYVAAKHACVGFTLALRMELVETGIHASVVCPGGVLTEWANSTEGNPMLPFFSESGPIVKRIAKERSTTLPSIEGVISPETVAERILECIYRPEAEVYTHMGSREFVALSAEKREKAEAFQVPVALGERAVYEGRKHEPGSKKRETGDRQ